VANILLTPLSDGTPAHIRIYSIFLATILIGLISPLMISVYLRSGERQNFCLLRGAGRFGLSRSSKVDEFGANRKYVCDFLLVRNSNLVLSCTVSELQHVLCAPDSTPIPP